MGSILSGNVTQSGVQLQGIITNTGLAVGLLSGAILTRLSDTGAALVARDAAISGGLEARVTASGNSSVTHGNGIGVNLSGNLASSGAALVQRDLDISGALQALIAGGGSVVRVSGSSPIATADLTGIGGIAVVYSGGRVFISGASNEGGGVPSVNNITAATTIVGTGDISVVTVGNNIYVSGSRPTPAILTFTAGAVTATNMTAALNFFAGSAAYITYADLSSYTGVALYINKTATAGAAASRLFLRYRDSYNATATNWTQDISSPVMQFPVNVQNTIITSGFRPLVPSAQSGVYLALMGTGGDGVLDPAFGLITAQFM